MTPADWPHEWAHYAVENERCRQAYDRLNYGGSFKGRALVHRFPVALVLEMYREAFALKKLRLLAGRAAW